MFQRLGNTEDLRRPKIEVPLISPFDIVDLRREHLFASWPTLAIRSDDLSVRSIKHHRRKTPNACLDSAEASLRT